MKLPRRLTLRQARIARARVKYPYDSQRKLGDRLGIKQPRLARELAKPHVARKIIELMDQHPLTTAPGLLKTLRDGLVAKETKVFAHEGVIIDKIHLVDHKTRHSFLETALELRGLKNKQEQGILNISMILMGGGTEEQRTQVAEATLAFRRARGLHPRENRRLTKQELEAGE